MLRVITTFVSPDKLVWFCVVSSGLFSRAGQIGYSLPPLRCLFGVVLPRRCVVEMDRNVTRYTLRRDTSSIVKICCDGKSFVILTSYQFYGVELRAK